MDGAYFIAHRWTWCELCGPCVACGKCGNNACNAGRGEVPGLTPGTMIPCDACDSANWLQRDGIVPQPLAERAALEFGA